MAKMEQLYKIKTNFQFKVEFHNLSFSAVFTECTLPSLQVETTEIKEGGQNAYSHVMPTRVKAGTLKLKHGMTENTQFIDWYMMVLSGDIAGATTNVTISLNSVSDEGDTIAIIATWNFSRAYPIKWSGPALKAGESNIAIEELELAYHEFSVG